MKTLIITGGSIDSDFALSFLKKTEIDYIIGVDKGLQFCFEQRIWPDYIVGDFDSLSPQILDWFKQNKKIPIREYNPVKDATDTMIALKKALEMQSEEIWIVGATGTRMDHVLCNIQILKNAWKEGIPAYIVDRNNLICLPVDKKFVLQRDKQFGKYVSFFPLGEEVKSLTLKGFKYDLNNYRLKEFEGLGVSNEIIEERASVSWDEGVLVMIQSQDS